MTLRQLVFGICFLLGITLILFHSQLVSYLSSSVDTRVVLASIPKLEGQAEVKNSDQQIIPAADNTSLHDGDTLNITGGTPVRIRFSDGLEVELDPGTIAFFENSDRGIFVNLRTGGFKGVAKGLGNERILFVKNGIVLDPLGRNLMQPPLKIEVQKEADEIKKPTEVSDDTLSDTQITSSMSNLRQPLLKCYAGVLKSNSKTKGEVYLSFTIEHSGNVSLVKLLQDSFKDEKMSKCVTDVVQRAQFDTFKGDPIVVNYPIYFE